MKTRAAILILSLAALTARAEPNTHTTNWFPAAVPILAAFTNAGDTGLSTGVAYVAFSVTELDTLTEAQATSNAFAVVHHLLVYLHDKWTATAVTNRPSTTTINESQTFTAGATNTITIYTGYGQTRTLTIDPAGD